MYITSQKKNCMCTGDVHCNNEDDHHEEAKHAAEARRGLVFSCGNVCRFGLVYVRALIYSKNHMNAKQEWTQFLKIHFTKDRDIDFVVDYLWSSPTSLHYSKVSGTGSCAAMQVHGSYPRQACGNMSESPVWENVDKSWWIKLFRVVFNIQYVRACVFHSVNYI